MDEATGRAPANGGRGWREDVARPRTRGEAGGTLQAWRRGGDAGATARKGKTSDDGREAGGASSIVATCENVAGDRGR